MEDPLNNTYEARGAERCLFLHATSLIPMLVEYQNISVIVISSIKYPCRWLYRT
jgi:hypothetical protein